MSLQNQTALQKLRNDLSAMERSLLEQFYSSKQRISDLFISQENTGRKITNHRKGLTELSKQTKDQSQKTQRTILDNDQEISKNLQALQMRSMQEGIGSFDEETVLLVQKWRLIDQKMNEIINLPEDRQSSDEIEGLRQQLETLKEEFQSIQGRCTEIKEYLSHAQRVNRQTVKKLMLGLTGQSEQDYNTQGDVVGPRRQQQLQFYQSYPQGLLAAAHQVPRENMMMLE